MNLTTATPTEIDTEWAIASETLAKAQLRYAAIQKAKATIEAALDAITIAEQQMRPYLTEWARRNGWTRAYIVPGGHVHRSTACHTLRWGTRISWLPECSGMDMDAIVELAGERACTVCYPDAPVDILSRPSRLWTAAERSDREVRDLRALELAAKREAKAAKGITAPDGSPLKVRAENSRYFDTLASERVAEIAAVDHLHDPATYGYGGVDAESFERIIEALAHKRGVSVDEVLTVVQAKAEKKIAKTNREIASYRAAQG